jgi:hypothetical protein
MDEKVSYIIVTYSNGVDAPTVITRTADAGLYVQASAAPFPAATITGIPASTA